MMFRQFIVMGKRKHQFVGHLKLESVVKATRSLPSLFHEKYLEWRRSLQPSANSEMEYLSATMYKGLSKLGEGVRSE